jgi:hypothetical protein
VVEAFSFPNLFSVVASFQDSGPRLDGFSLHIVPSIPQGVSGGHAVLAGPLLVGPEYVSVGASPPLPPFFENGLPHLSAGSVLDLRIPIVLAHDGQQLERILAGEDVQLLLFSRHYWFPP